MDSRVRVHRAAHFAHLQGEPVQKIGRKALTLAQAMSSRGHRSINRQQGQAGLNIATEREGERERDIRGVLERLWRRVGFETGEGEA